MIGPRLRAEVTACAAELRAAEFKAVVTPHPLLRGRVEAVWPGGVMIGPAAEVYAELRRLGMERRRWAWWRKR